MKVQWNLSKATTYGTKIIDYIRKVVLLQVVLNIKGSFRTTGSGHNREVVALYRWPLEQVPLYILFVQLF